MLQRLILEEQLLAAFFTMLMIFSIILVVFLKD